VTVAPLLPMLLAQTRAEFVTRWRVPAFSMTSLVLPILFFTFFGLPFARQSFPNGVSMGAYLLASFAAYAVGNVMVYGFGIGVAVERGQKVDVLLRATPLPPAVAISAKVLNALVFSFLSIAALILYGILVGGVRLRWFAALGAPVIVLAPIMWRHLKAYQQRRILTFLNPDMDPLGAGYHVIQSKIAVGSGMLWGKGFLQGTQNHLNFLPEQHTDFIFSVFAEEWGFVGTMVLMTLYLAIILRCLLIASHARDRFGVLLVLGMAGIIFWQAVINVGMTTGLMPVVGIPLPFFSYGGSSLLCLLVGTGLAMNVSMRRYYF